MTPHGVEKTDRANGIRQPFIAGLLVFLVAMPHVTGLPSLIGAYALFGAAMAGVMIGWSLGPLHFAQAANAVMQNQEDGGVIINIASVAGLMGNAGQANYAASKGGEIALSKTLARELGKFNVNVNVVAPGMVMTDMAAAIPRSLKEALGFWPSFL